MTRNSPDLTSNFLEVLIVEDEPDAAEEIVDILEGLELRTICARSGDEALQLIHRGNLPSIIISDIRMPGLSGLEFVDHVLAEYDKGRQCALIFISGHADLETVISALRFEAIDFIRKPIQREALIEAVNRAKTRVISQLAEATRQASIVSDLRAFKLQADKVSQLIAQLPKRSPLHSLGLTEGLTDNAKISLSQSEAWQEMLTKLQHLRQAQRSIGDPSLAESAALDMLLDLLSAELAKDDVTVTSLCAAAGVSQTTALRRLEDLEQAQFLIRQPDKKDRRRIFVTLTPAGRERVAAYLSSVSHLIA